MFKYVGQKKGFYSNIEIFLQAYMAIIVEPDEQLF